MNKNFYKRTHFKKRPQSPGGRSLIHEKNQAPYFIKPKEQKLKRISRGLEDSDTNDSLKRQNIQKRMGRIGKLVQNVMKNENIQESEIGEILLDKNICFHGIGYDPMRLASILQNGIVSEKDSYKQGVKIRRNYDSRAAYNRDFAISVCDSPAVDNGVGDYAFDTYIENQISFVIKGMKKFKLPDTPFQDEKHLIDHVNKEKIAAIMLPVKMLDTDISKIAYRIAASDKWLVENNCLHYLSDLEATLGISCDNVKLKNIFENHDDKNSLGNKKIKIMEQLMGEYTKKAYQEVLNKKDITLRDVLKYHLPEDMKVVNTNGVEIFILES